MVGSSALVSGRRSGKTSAIVVSAVAFALTCSHPVVTWPAASVTGPAQLRRGAVRELETGKLLVAARNLPDPNFASTVVLLADYNAQGAMGLIVNRPTKVTLARLLPGLEQAPDKASSATVFFGGPVSPSGVLALLRSSTRRPDSRRVVNDVYLVSTGDVLKETIAAGSGSERVRVYVGYAGWGPGQLEAETAEGSWHVLDGDGDVVFDPDPQSSWRRQIQRAEALTARAPGPGPFHEKPTGGTKVQLAWQLPRAYFLAGNRR